MGWTIPINWLAGFLPSTVSYGVQKESRFRCLVPPRVLVFLPTKNTKTAKQNALYFPQVLRIQLCFLHLCVCVCPFCLIKIHFCLGGWLGVIAPRNATFCLTHSDKIALVKNGADRWFHMWQDTYHIQIERQFKIYRYAMYVSTLHSIYLHKYNFVCILYTVYYILYRCM